MNQIIEKLKRADYRAEFFRVLCDWHRAWIHSIYSLWYRTKCRLIGVNIGRGVCFNGKAYISRFKHSTISIGNNCIFNSHDLFNSRGTRSCIIGTFTDFAKIEIGNNTGFSGVSISASNYVKIGNNVIIGTETVIYDDDGHPERIPTIVAPVIIGNNVFKGCTFLNYRGKVTAFSCYGQIFSEKSDFSPYFFNFFRTQ